MKAYAEFEFYISRYDSLIDNPAQFNALAEKASRYIDRITFGRLKNMTEAPEEVKLAVCALVDEMYKADNEKAATPPDIKSENTDGYSVTYATEAEQSANFQKRMLEAVRLYLPASHPLRYAGVD